MRRRSEPNELRRTLLQLSLAIDNASSYVRSLRKTQRKPEASFRSTSGPLPVWWAAHCFTIETLLDCFCLVFISHVDFRFTLGLFPVYTWFVSGLVSIPMSCHWDALECIRRGFLCRLLPVDFRTGGCLPPLCSSAGILTKDSFEGSLWDSWQLRRWFGSNVNKSNKMAFFFCFRMESNQADVSPHPANT